MTTVGFIGLGSMGMPMAHNLLAKGFAVQGFDVRNGSVAALAARGARPATSAAAAAAGADALVLMVVNAAQAEQALFADGALESLPEGSAVILMATCPPGAVAALAARVEAAGRRFVDAPVSGGVVGAVAGTLSIMAAAPAAVMERIRPVLAAMGGKVFHVGEQAGQGATVKTVNQLLCGVHIAVVAEAFALAAKVGVRLDILLEIMSGSAASSWMLKDRGPRMLHTDPEITSAVDIFVKDLGIVLEAGRDARAALPLAAAAHQMFLAASGRGEGAMDDSQVIRSYHAINGTNQGTNRPSS
ncbi:NAD(P)-dependent oxidoreductase [Azospirillum sp. 412522]|nr:NAD(P)-dependent oxidoreductase [Azospirillum sp. 412522]MBY6260870.1 NAD(P)-dependent oxidoreductase [Azospirillum sp. 412522]